MSAPRIDVRVDTMPETRIVRVSNGQNNITATLNAGMTPKIAVYHDDRGSNVRLDPDDLRRLADAAEDELYDMNEREEEL
jgi:hypothetical protein